MTSGYGQLVPSSLPRQKENKSDRNCPIADDGSRQTETFATAIAAKLVLEF
jgi:hypothetical protein